MVRGNTAPCYIAKLERSHISHVYLFQAMSWSVTHVRSGELKSQRSTNLFSKNFLITGKKKDFE